MDGRPDASTGGRARAVGVGVVGIEHLHCFELVDGLVRAGAQTVAHADAGGPLGEAYAAWRTESVEVSVTELLADPSVDLVVLAGVPAERAAVAVAALEAGKSVLSDKPGVTTTAQLAAVREAVESSSGRAGRWWVLFSERFGVPAVMEAVALARSGAVGAVVHVQGSAPHRGSLAARPTWFFDRARSGGILVDLGSHQADQFLAVTGATDVEVVAAAAGQVGAAPPTVGAECTSAAAAAGSFEDIGEMVLACGSVRGHHRVDYLEADGFPTWGDVRLTVTGTAGRIEVRTPVLDGTAATPEVLLTDDEGVRPVPVTAEVDWPRLLLADLADGGERLMSRDHPFRVSELTLRAAAAARPWRSP